MKAAARRSTIFWVALCHIMFVQVTQAMYFYAEPD